MKWAAFDGSTWSPAQDSGWISATPPALCAFFDGTATGRLYLVGTDPGDDHLWIARFPQDGVGAWAAPVHLPYHKCCDGAALAGQPTQ